MNEDLVALLAVELHRYECEHLDSSEAVCPGPSTWDRERVEHLLTVMAKQAS